MKPLNDLDVTMTVTDLDAQRDARGAIFKYALFTMLQLVSTTFPWGGNPPTTESTIIGGAFTVMWLALLLKHARRYDAASRETTIEEFLAEQEAGTK